MASAFNNFINLFGKSEAEKRAEMTQGLFGSPNAVRTDGTMYSADVNEQGQEVNQQMTAQEPSYQSTGLFEGLRPEQVPQMQYAKELMASGDAGMQKQSMKAVEDVLAMEAGGGQPSASDYLDARVNAYGAPVKMVNGKNVNEGKMQRALMDSEGNPDWKGTAYDPRQSYVKTGTEYTDVYGNKPDIPINIAQAKFEEERGKADFEFLDNYGINVDKGESALEAMDFLSSGLDKLVESATGWSTGWGAFMKDVPTTDANAWNTMKTTVLSGLGIGKMEELKALSSSGSTGFGALNEKELELLTSYKGKLEQTNDPKVIKKIINDMKKLVSSARRRTVRSLTNAEKRFNKLAPSRGYDTTGVTPQANNLEPAAKPTRTWGQ